MSRSFDERAVAAATAHLAKLGMTDVASLGYLLLGAVDAGERVLVGVFVGEPGDDDRDRERQPARLAGLLAAAARSHPDYARRDAVRLVVTGEDRAVLQYYRDL